MEQNTTPQPTPEEPKGTKSAGMSDNKIFAILGYLFPPLFFIPLLNDKMKTDSTVRFHVNQQLILLTMYVALYILVHMLNIMMLGFAGWIVELSQFALLVLGLYGAYNAFKDETKELPLVGHLRILK